VKTLNILKNELKIIEKIIEMDPYSNSNNEMTKKLIVKLGVRDVGFLEK
jgi:hypothetical protein